MSGLDSLWIWEDPDLLGKMTWYRDVEEARIPAKYRIAGRVPVDVNLAEASDSALWNVFHRHTLEFDEIRKRIRSQQTGLPISPEPPPTLLDLCGELSRRMLRKCNFCRWNCGVDRSEGLKSGTCKLNGTSRVSSFFHHQGEELIFRGTTGSGTIFFTSCNMRCAFCQNGDISADRFNGIPVSSRVLATIAWLLDREGCHNINWVGGEATIHLHTICAAFVKLENLEPSMDELRAALPVKNDLIGFHEIREQFQPSREGPNAPMLWNSNFFMSEPALHLLRVLMDLWLPDFKFGPGRCSVSLSRTPWYWQTVTENLRQLHEWGEEVVIRHLVMPGHLECCTRPILEWLSENLADVPVNLMGQYHPELYCDPGSTRYQKKYEPLSRSIRPDELEKAYSMAEDFGIPYRALSLERKRRFKLL